MPGKQLFDEEPVAPVHGIVPLHQLVEGQEADFFALLAEKQILTTRDNKPYYRVTFRDSKREVSFPIWNDAPLATACREEWQPGQFYKLRAAYRETTYGPQLDLHRVRLATEADCSDGFDPLMCLARSQFNAEQMFADLMELADQHIEHVILRDIVKGLYEQHRVELLALPAARHNHHAFVGGYLEHVRNVSRHAAQLAVSYRATYGDDAPVDVGLAVAGAILHDIGKLLELQTSPAGAEYSPSGHLIGHVLQGRDMFRDACRGTEIDPETKLRIEHIIVSHQRLPEWGAPKPPMTIEALIVHHADDLDAKLQMMLTALAETADGEVFTSKRNPLRMAIYKGEA